LPDNKVLGPRFGKKFPALRTALNAAKASDVAQHVAAGENVVLDLDGEPITLAANEILVQTQAGEGLAVASGDGITVAVDTTLTPELVAEGLAREFVRAVQTMRKDAGLNIQDRIQMRYETSSPAVRAMLEQFRDYVTRETLTTDLAEGGGGEDWYTSPVHVENEPVKISIKRV
jgi:isoleucyl-tRNA synthetase